MLRVDVKMFVLECVYVNRYKHVQLPKTNLISIMGDYKSFQFS